MQQRSALPQYPQARTKGLIRCKCTVSSTLGSWLGAKMKLQLEWSRPILLRDARRGANLLYIFDHAKLPEAAGVYVFGRRFGRNFEALYVGQAGEIRSHGFTVEKPVELSASELAIVTARPVVATAADGGRHAADHAKGTAGAGGLTKRRCFAGRNE
jgi:hypothetical protein